ncbi:MAG: hypothetical protein WC710_14655 [Gallionella sp.]|jgi:hypothetical protein
MGSSSIFTLFALLFIVGLAYAAYSIIAGLFKPNGQISDSANTICTHCGTRGSPKRITRGNLATEIILWICFIIPGLIYSIWRLTTKQDVCPSCEQPGMININTPKGRLLMEKFQSKTM